MGSQKPAATTDNRQQPQSANTPGSSNQFQQNQMSQREREAERARQTTSAYGGPPLDPSDQFR